MHALIIDDQTLFLQGLAQTLLEQTDITTVSEADSMQSARSIIAAKHDELDLILLDHGLPDGQGLALLKEIGANHPLLPVAMLSAHEDYKLMREAIDAGALGFIPKSTSPQVLLSAINLVLAGGIYIPPSLYRISQQTQPAIQKTDLTPRQEEVLHLLRNGHANKEIAWRLGISEATVKAHVTVILKSHGVSSRQMLLSKQSDTVQL